jgi:putative ABC transport system permease protein
LDGIGAHCLKDQDQDVDALAGEAVVVLRKTRGLKPGEPNDFLVYSSEDVRKGFLKASRSFRLASGVAAMVSALLAVSVAWYLFTLLAQQRRLEMGIQRALGASRTQVIRGHIAGAWTLLALSVTLGILMSWAATWVIRTRFAGHNTDYAIDWKLFISTSFQDVFITFATWASLGTCMALLPVCKALKMPLPELLKQ